MKNIIVTLLFITFSFYGQSQAILRDAFGRNLSGHTIILVDWEGYMANPAIKLTVETTHFTGWVSVNGNGSRLYMNESSISGIGTTGPIKSFYITDSTRKEFYLSIFPDRGGGDEDYTLTFQSNFGRENYPIHVIDQDSDNPVIDFNIDINYSFDKPAYNFFADQTHKDIVRQAADDWAFFLQNMNFDTIKTGGRVFIWNDDYNGGILTTNPVTFKGFLLNAYGFHSTTHRSGGGANNYYFQSINGAPTALRPIGDYNAEVHGNYNTLGYKYYTDDTWYDANNLAGTQNDLYSIAMHEIGHTLGFFEAYPAFQAYQSKGYVDDSEVVAYQGANVPVDASSHLSGGDPSNPLRQVDRISKWGAFGSDYAHFMPYGRWLITKLNLLVLKAIGYKLKLTSAFKETAITSQSLVNGTTGQHYAARIMADGGIPFYKFDVVSGTLPQGLTLDSFDGSVSGTGLQPGTFTFTARVTDYDNKFAERTFTITILAALPTRLAGFNAARNDCNTFTLSWKTTREENNKGFEIEQSADGNNFYKTGFVDGKPANLNVSQTYSFSGADLKQGATYFRLKQIDNDNQFYYSPIVIIQNNCSISPIVVSPNPVTSWLHIQGMGSSPSDIKLVDAAGRVVARWSKTVQRDFNVNNILPGVYFIIINDHEKFKIVKK